MLSARAQFCGGCGQPYGDRLQWHALSPGDAAKIATTSYGLVLLSNVADLGAQLHAWQGFGWTEWLMVACAALASAALARYGGLGWLAAPQQLSFRGVAKAVFGVALAYASAEALGQLLPTSDQLMLLEYRAEDGGLGAALFSIAVLTPLLEEWFFRGVMLECMLAVFPARAAVIVTALLFAMLHLTPTTIVHHGLIGYLCGRVRLGTGSVWPAVACHSFYNALVVLQAW